MNCYNSFQIMENYSHVHMPDRPEAVGGDQVMLFLYYFLLAHLVFKGYKNSNEGSGIDNGIDD